MHRCTPTEGGPYLSVVVPVFNQAASIVANLEVIRDRVHADIGDDFEIVVVSDGSIDETEEELLGRAPEGSIRVFHYDRNLGKGFAVKLGALEARGRWIGFVDADLDLDPGSLAAYVRRAEASNLDFAIGSKRHPDSKVSYPQSRVIASWLFQQLVRVLFRLNVRDTQAGLKVFRRDIAEQVLPLLLVKRYAFDIELLAVAHAFGFTRIEEMPIHLDYRFTGSGVRSRAVMRALIDTAAIFYRLRILRYYQRQRRFAGAYAFTRPRATPSVSVLLPTGGRFRERDFPEVELLEVDLPSSGTPTVADYRPSARAATGAALAILRPGVRAAGNWLSATTPFLARPEIAAVVVPKMAPMTGSVRERAAAAVVESRVGAGSGYFRYTPGNVRYVDDFPAAAIVVRRETFLAVADDVPLDRVVAAVTRHGERALYTPETVVVTNTPPLFGPHLRTVWERAREHGARVRRGDLGRPRVSSAVMAAAAAIVVLVVVSILDLPLAVGAFAVIAAGYVLSVLVASAVAALRHQSVRVGTLTVPGIVATHLAYAAAFARGLAAG